MDLQAVKAQFFKALANPVRIRLLERLVQGEARVQDLQKALGLEQPIVSQQLARLRASGIVVTRKEGATIYYGVADPMIGEVLRVAKSILNRQLVGVQSLLRKLATEASRLKAQGSSRLRP